MTKQELNDFIGYAYRRDSKIDPQRLYNLVSDYLNDLHTEECEDKFERDRPSEQFEDEDLNFQ